MNILIHNIKSFCNILLITMVSCSTLWANVELPHSPAIQGYSPVFYFEKDKVAMGLPQFSTKYKGKLYWLTSADQAQYLPKFEAFCPYALALGRKVAIDPTNFKIVAGQLLLFHRSNELDSLKGWNHSDNEKELLRRAKNNYLSLNF
ncbi:MAG: hypothetical protein V3R25_04375 [Nitrosomonadaceae bacterium]